jgi:hypothetical protein
MKNYILSFLLLQLVTFVMSGCSEKDPASDPTDTGKNANNGTPTGPISGQDVVVDVTKVVVPDFVGFGTQYNQKNTIFIMFMMWYRWISFVYIVLHDLLKFEFKVQIIINTNIESPFARHYFISHNIKYL